MLNKVQLATELQAAMDAVSDVNVEPSVLRQQYAEAMANAIDNYVKQAAIVYVAGLIAPPGGGPVTGTFSGQLA